MFGGLIVKCNCFIQVRCSCCVFLVVHTLFMPVSYFFDYQHSLSNINGIYWLHNNSYHPNYCLLVIPNSNTSRWHQNFILETSRPLGKFATLSTWFLKSKFSEFTFVALCCRGQHVSIMFVFFIFPFWLWTFVGFLHLIFVEFWDSTTSISEPRSWCFQIIVDFFLKQKMTP